MIHSFTYKSPTSLKEAISSLGAEWGKVELLAGGSDLLALMKDQLATPETVINVKGIAGLSGIEAKEGSIKIGAATTLADLAEHALVQKHAKALAIAAAGLGSTQIRNVATVGGNLCQRTRDWYFRNGLAPEVKEELQYAAIFPMEGQTYVHPSTLAPVFIALGATATVAGPKGERQVAVEKLFQVSDLKTKREIAIAPNEIITAIVIPTGLATGNIEVRERQSHDWPLVQAAAGLSLKEGKVAKAAIVLGHVAPVPRRVSAAEEALVGKPVDEALATSAGKLAAEGAKGTPKNDYKVALVKVAVKRAILAATGNE